MTATETKWDVERPLSTTPEAAALRQVWKFIWGNLFFLGGGLIAGIVAGVAAQHFLPRTYEAEGRFVVDEMPFLHSLQSGSQNNNVLIDNGTQNDLVQSLVMGVPSAAMRTELAAQLKVEERQICFLDLGGRPISLRSKDPVANIRITPVRNSRMGTIDVTSQSGEFAAATVNTLLDELQYYNIAQGRLNALDMLKQVATVRLEAVRTDLAGVKQGVNWQEQQVAQLDEYIKKGQPLESFPDFSADTTLNNLKTERLLNQAEYAGLSTSSSGGVQLEKKKAQVEDINKEIGQEGESLAHGMRSQLEATRLQDRNLESELTNRLGEIQRYGHEREQWVQSFGDITQMKKMINDKIDIPSQGGSVIVVVGRAVAPDRPKSPKLWLNLFAGVFVCELAGLFLAVVRTLLDDRLVSPQSVPTLTKLPCIATTQAVGMFSQRLEAAAPRAPGFNPLRSRMLLDSEDENLQTIGFTPARKREQASRTVADLALMLARAGRRILVVDLNFANPQQFELLRIKPQPGLAEWMASDRPIEEYIWPGDVPGLSLLSCSPESPLPTPELLLRRPLAKVLPRLEETWDFILIDAPPISKSWELMLTLPAGRPVVITARKSRTRASHVSHTASLAQNQSWNVAGVALQGH